MAQINESKLYERLSDMTEDEREKVLDPICAAVDGKVKFGDHDGCWVSPNRIFALAVLDLYREWQEEVSSRD